MRNMLQGGEARKVHIQPHAWAESPWQPLAWGGERVGRQLSHPGGETEEERERKRAGSKDYFNGLERRAKCQHLDSLNPAVLDVWEGLGQWGGECGLWNSRVKVEE